MSNASDAKGTKVQSEQEQQGAQAGQTETTKKQWFDFMKQDELAPEETRETAFLGYN